MKALEAYLAVRQNSKISLLAGLAAGITQEVLCGVDDKEFPMPDAWRESCQMSLGFKRSTYCKLLYIYMNLLQMICFLVIKIIHI